MPQQSTAYNHTMKKPGLILLLGALALVFSIAATRWFTSPARKGEVAIEMLAEDFRFKPHEIRVKTGARVTLRIRATDDKHGIAFKLVPEGQPEGSAPGLQFSTANPDWILEKGQEQTIRFTALRPGRYEFACSVFCGMGHNEMLGRIVVE